MRKSNWTGDDPSFETDDGHVYFKDTDIKGLSNKEMKEMRKNVQIIFQDPSACLNPRRNIRKILERAISDSWY